MYHIEIFQTSEVKRFNEALRSVSYHRLATHHVAVMRRASTCVLAVFDDEPQVCGFPQVVIWGGNCSPISFWRGKAKEALKGVLLLLEEGLTLEFLTNYVREDLGLHPTDRRSSAELVEVYWTLCCEVGQDKISTDDARASFVKRWKEKLGNKTSEDFE